MLKIKRRYAGQLNIDFILIDWSLETHFWTLELALSKRSECRFPAEYFGRWVTFDESVGVVSEVYIDSGEIRTPSYGGSLICKSTHWEMSHYKVLLVSDNGWFV